MFPKMIYIKMNKSYVRSLMCINYLHICAHTDTQCWCKISFPEILNWILVASDAKTKNIVNTFLIKIM